MTDTNRKRTASQREAMRMLVAKKHLWRDQVIFDHRLSGLTKAVAYGMANWLAKRETCERYLSTHHIVIAGTQRELADMVGCSAKTVHLATASLIEHGHITLIRRPQNRMDTNQYGVILRSDDSPRLAQQVDEASFALAASF